MNKRPADRGSVAEILGSGGLLSRQLAGYEPRVAQLTMARAVLGTLESDGRLVVEAGTGTGKTLAYLAPALLSGLKVVISTGTKTLQEQIFRKDIPLLLEATHARGELGVACMKGIGNYLCVRRLAAARRAPELLPDPQLARLLRWAETTETGDRAELDGLPDDAPLWAEVSPTPETRLGPRCPCYEECFVTRMRRAAASARLIVVNHHLLLADLALRSQYPEACVIPPFEALVIDEAHQLEAIATSFFGRSLSGACLATLARDVRRAALRVDDEAALRLARHAEESYAELFHLLAGVLPELATGDSRLRLADPPFCGRLLQPYLAADASLEALAEHLALRAGADEELGNLAQRAQSTRDTATLFAEAPARGFIFWAERRAGAGSSLHASPVEAGDLLRGTLLAEMVPIVFTSATLATRGVAASDDPPCSRAGADDRAAGMAGLARGALAYFRARVGLEPGEAEELILPSPFDFARQVLLYLAADLPDPSDPRFILCACERASQLIDITAGRALCLFTSYRNLQQARELLAPQLDYPLLCQGDAPRPALLERFRREVSSVLLATASFWEGVDVVGESLSLVIIDKLPFAVPSDPLTAARIQLLRERGEDPFSTYQLPQAALALKQGFGRLIRHRSDSGIVALLDRRVLHRAYGRVLLDSLPPCPRTCDLLRVRAFAKQVLQPASSRARPVEMPPRASPLLNHEP